MSLEIRPLPLAGALFDGAMKAYAAAFALPPYSDAFRAAEVRERIHAVHAPREGFRALCAVEGDGTVAGMIYGYRSARGQWWNDYVRAALGDETLPLEGAYEVVELAVEPSRQRQGIGRALLVALLAPCEEPFAVLSTRCDSGAPELYRSMGFSERGRVTFPANPNPYWIMVKDLRTTAAT